MCYPLPGASCHWPTSAPGAISTVSPPFPPLLLPPPPDYDDEETDLVISTLRSIAGPVDSSVPFPRIALVLALALGLATEDLIDSWTASPACTE